MMNDPRPAYEQAHAWCLDLVRDLRPEEFGAATPCPDWEVRTIVAHVIGAVDRARVVAQGADPFSVPIVPECIADADLADRYAEALAACARVWADDAVLDREMTPPWGTVPGRLALAGWIKEPLVHGWDIAVATGRPCEAPAELAGPDLAMAQQIFPAETRAEMPFAAPVAPAAGAGPTEQLANWMGHARI